MKQVKTNYIKHKIETIQEGITFSLILGLRQMTPPPQADSPRRRGILPHNPLNSPLTKGDSGGCRNIGKIKPLKDNPLLHFTFKKENTVCIQY